jgi:hypothetical protein
VSPESEETPVRRPFLLLLTLAALAVGCGKTESDPRPVNVKPDPQLKRMGAGNPNQPKDRVVRPHQLPP